MSDLPVHEAIARGLYEEIGQLPGFDCDCELDEISPSNTEQRWQVYGSADEPPRRSYRIILVEDCVIFRWFDSGKQYTRRLQYEDPDWVDNIVGRLYELGWKIRIGDMGVTAPGI